MRNVQNALYLALFHPFAGFPIVHGLCVYGYLRRGVEPTDVLPAKAAVRVVDHCHRSVGHDIGSIHIVIEQPINKDTSHQYQQYGIAGADGTKLTCDDKGNLRKFTGCFHIYD